MELISIIFLLLFPDFVFTDNVKDPDLVCPSEPIGAEKDNDVTLPCHLEPPMDASAETVKWTQGNHVVHLHQRGEVDTSEQWERFKGRTSLSSEGLTEGNLSLTLSSVNVHDDGRYQCSLRTESLSKMCYIDLNVEPSLVCPSEHIEVMSGEDVILPCHLEPSVDASGEMVSWRRRNKNVLLYDGEKRNPAEELHQSTGPAHLFSQWLTEGNLSLKLSSVSLRDNGKYWCHFITKSMERSCSVILTVAEPEVVVPGETVKVERGHHAILPCHVEPSKDLRNLTVEWRHNNVMVHLYRSQKDVPEMQDERFQNRSSLFHEELIHGNFSLKLTNVTTEDAGNYTCYIPKLEGKFNKGNVTLNIGPVPERMCTFPGPHKNETHGVDPSPWCSLAIFFCIAFVIFLLISITISVLWRTRPEICNKAEQQGENDNHLEDVVNNHEEERPGPQGMAQQRSASI